MPSLLIEFYRTPNLLPQALEVVKNYFQLFFDLPNPLTDRIKSLMPSVVPFITKANASELGKLSGISRREHGTNRPKKPKENLPEQITGYAKEVLTRTRKQVRATLDMLAAETDPQKLDRLASALARLNEIERQLANRPLPGSWKPQAPRPAARARSEPVALPQATISSVQPSAPSSDLPK